MKSLIKIFLILSLFLSQNLSALTRAQVIDEANLYKNYSWIVGLNNILDVKKYDSDKKQMVPGSDGIDDRMEFVLNSDGTTNWAAMRANWPFKPEDKVTGEAYAWGYGHYAKPDMKPPDDVLKKWDANQTKSFEEYLRFSLYSLRIF